MSDDDQRKRGEQKAFEFEAKEGQRELPLAPFQPPPVVAPERRAFRVIRGEGRGRDETLRTRDDVARLMMASAADMMLHRISPERAYEIEEQVERVMRLFDKPRSAIIDSQLRLELDDLEALWREGRVRH